MYGVRALEGRSIVVFMKKQVKINGKIVSVVVIKENDILVYKYHVCAHCSERIPHMEYHIRKGIPRFIYGHQNKGEYNPMCGHKYTKETLEKMSKNHANFSGKNNPMSDVHRFGEDNPNFKDGYGGQDRSNSKQQDKGFNPLNKKNNVSTTMHHLSDGETVIFEPEAFHKACYHSYPKDHPKYEEHKKMADEIALMWYSIEWFYIRGISIE